MNFTKAGSVEADVYAMLLADQPRADNRALVNALFNGEGPYSEEEIEQNHASTNVNDLSATVINQNARAQFDNAFLLPDPLFSIEVDYGPRHKRIEWGTIITRSINRIIKNSADFAELQSSVFASTVLHGPGPSMWEDQDAWLQEPLGVEDVLIPGNTLRSMRNLEKFAVYRQYTAAKLWRMTHGPRVDPAWNMPLVDKVLAWVDQEAKNGMGQTWPDVWFPEKIQERFKSDSGIYAGDISPTVNCWDFYFWSDENDVSGWRRRIILDAWGQPGVGGAPLSATRKGIGEKVGKDQFLYNPKERCYASKLSEIMHFQCGDASAVAPFRYHSQRSLGWLLYAVCHLQNRLYCKFTDSVFENLLQYFRVANPMDMERLTKIDLIDKGLLPEGLQFVRPEERWKVDQPLVSEAFAMSRQRMNDMSTSFTQDLDLENQSEETATRTMAKVNSAAALTGAILNRAYMREKFRFVEICRRFCRKDSKNPDVKKFRVEVLNEHIPEEALNVDCWNVQPTKVIGGGNKVLGVAMADKLMAIRPQLGPEAQHTVDRIYISTNTNNWDLAQQLVPQEPHISDSIHDAELAFGALMQGIQITPKPGLNAVEVIETILRLMGAKVQGIMQTDGVGTPQDVQGLKLAASYAQAFINMLAQDKNEKSRVKNFGDVLGNIGNDVKAMAQRQQEAAQAAAANNGNGVDPDTQAKIDALLLTARTKSQLAAQSHAQKTAQKQIAFEQKVKQDEEKHALQTSHAMREHAAELAKTELEAATALARKPEPKPKKE